MSNITTNGRLKGRHGFNLVTRSPMDIAEGIPYLCVFR